MLSPKSLIPWSPLINKDGNTVGENDDGPDGTTNSLLFARITESGMYTVRVRSYAGQGNWRLLPESGPAAGN